MRNFIDNILGKILIAIMAVMVVNVLWQVFARFVLQSPSSVTDELARYLLIWVGLLGAAFATGKKMHLAIDIIPSRLGPGAQKGLNVAINLVVITFALLVMVVGGIKLVYITLTLNQISAALSMPLGYVYAVLPLSGIIIIFYSVLNLVEKPVPERAQKPDWQPDQV